MLASLEEDILLLLEAVCEAIVGALDAGDPATAGLRSEAVALLALAFLFVGELTPGGPGAELEEDSELELAVDPDGVAIVRHLNTLTNVVGPTRVTVLYLLRFHSTSSSTEVELGSGTDTV